MPGVFSSFRSDSRGSIGPLYALALFALIGIAAVGFDFGRLVALHSELQNAADQAALAAATQLDGQDDAMTRARNAANTTFASAVSPYANETRIADDGAGRPITSLSFTFFEDYANDQPGAQLTSDAQGAQASVVKVTVNARRVYYALTPVVGAFTSGDVNADAMAMLKRAVCRLPPIMVCVDRNDFPKPSDEGRGLRMRWRSSSDVDPLAPGNFGFLDLYKEHDSQYELGENKEYADCAKVENVTTEPGFRTTETPALNTRFDMYKNPLFCRGNGDFCPAENTRKNQVLVEKKKIQTATADPPLPGQVPQCGNYDSRSDWQPNAAVGNFAFDDCFSSGTCTYLGDGTWNIGAYLAANHPGVTPSDFAKGTRFEIYKWELEDPANRLAPRLVAQSVTEPKKKGAVWEREYTNYCAYPQPVFGAALPPTSARKDRRILTVAAINCRDLNGRSPVNILGWMDVFLIGPADDGELGTIQAEVIGPAVRPDGTTGFQYYGRNRAVLIR